jgi:uncharacterized membrane protein YuzA (DUF378 family)
MKAVNIIALILIIVGGVNWGLVGIFNIDLVASLFGDMSVAARTVYSLVGLAALYSISILAKEMKA